MSAILPGERMALNVFEPRYRLMVRRVMEGGRKFGMATINGGHQLDDIACEVEVVECDPLPDGRFYLEVLGRRRFKPLNPCEQDGYRLAQVEYVSDSVASAGSPEEAELQEISRRVEEMADTWVSRVRTLGQSRRAAADLLRRVGEKPLAGNVEQLSFWVVSYW
jgi:Lon protease-like protein